MNKLLRRIKTKIKGDCSGLYGNCSGLGGDLDSCELTIEDRNTKINIEDLIGE